MSKDEEEEQRLTVTGEGRVTYLTGRDNNNCVVIVIFLAETCEDFFWNSPFLSGTVIFRNN